MPRRSGSTVPVSFFSFQDLLLCLIGIAIVIAMTLVLQVADVTARVLESANDRSDVRIPLDDRERALRDRVAALTAALKSAAARMDPDPLAERTTLRLELRRLSLDLEHYESMAKELEDELRNLLLENSGAAELREYMELVRIRDELAAKLQSMEQRKEISFIVDKTESLRPIVMELSKGRIVVTDVATGEPYRIAAGTDESQCNHALRLFSALSEGAPSYILIIVTPSGIALESKLRSAILALPEESRPRIGLDLIPEGSSISRFFPSGQRGGA